MVVSRHPPSHAFLINFSNLFASAPNAVLLPAPKHVIADGQIFAFAGNSFKSSGKQASKPEQHRVDCVLAPPAAGCVCIDRCKYFSYDSFRPLKQIAILPRFLPLVPSSALACLRCSRYKGENVFRPVQTCRFHFVPALGLHECARLVFWGLEVVCVSHMLRLELLALHTFSSPPALLHHLHPLPASP